MSSNANSNQVRQIVETISKCSELWGEIRVLTRTYPTMTSGIFHDAAYSFETTLQDGENSIKEFMFVPKNQVAFNQGDSTSYAALSSVIDSQRGLLSKLEDIKRQLARAYNEQFTPSKSKQSAIDPDKVLNLSHIMGMRDEAQEHVTSTSRCLKELARRIEAKESSQSQQRPRSQQQPYQPQQTPYRPAPQPEYESVPDMPPRPPPQRPVRQPLPQQQQAIPPTPMSPTVPIPVDPDAKIPNPNAVPAVGDRPGVYCTGALRLQRDSTLTIRDILRDSKDTTAPLLCRYCNLRLGDDGFRDAVMQGQRKGTTLAKQHLLACASLWDRRAMFKCLVCTNEELPSEFRDVEDFKAHMKCH